MAMMKRIMADAPRAHMMGFRKGDTIIVETMFFDGQWCITDHRGQVHKLVHLEPLDTFDQYELKDARTTS